MTDKPEPIFYLPYCYGGRDGIHCAECGLALPKESVTRHVVEGPQLRTCAQSRTYKDRTCSCGHVDAELMSVSFLEIPVTVMPSKEDLDAEQESYRKDLTKRFSSTVVRPEYYGVLVLSTLLDEEDS